MAVDGVGLVPTEILTPWAPAPNGPVISSATSTCFCAGRRDKRAGFNRASISFSGSVTGLGSCSPPELTNTPGAAWRNSPNASFTEPNASWVRTFSSGMEIIAPGGGACSTLARKSIGSVARMDCSGSCNSSGFSAGAGGMVDIGVAGMGAGIGDGVLAAGGIVRGNAVATGAAPAGSAGLVRTRGVWGAAASLSSRRRNKPRSNPANFVFTLVDMTLILHSLPVKIDRLTCFSRKHANGCF